MAKRGRPVQFGDLKPVTTKLQAETKNLCDALIAIKSFGSLREILEEGLKVLEEKDPETFVRARAYMELMNKEKEE